MKSVQILSTLNKVPILFQPWVVYGAQLLAIGLDLVEEKQFIIL